MEAPVGVGVVRNSGRVVVVLELVAVAAEVVAALGCAAVGGGAVGGGAGGYHEVSPSTSARSS